MRKAYKKPEIMFESFVSSVNIAGDCEAKTDTSNSGYCGIDFGAGVVFMKIDPTECTIKVDVMPEYEKPDGSYFDKLCYHIPYGANLFNS